MAPSGAIGAKGEGDGTVDTENGRVVLNVGSIAQEVIARLDEQLGDDLSSRVSEEQLQSAIVCSSRKSSPTLRPQSVWWTACPGSR